MVGWVSRGDALEARFRHLVALLDEGADDPSQLFAVLSGDCIAIAVELIGRHLVRADGEVETVVGDLQVEAAASGGRKIGAQVLLVGALVGSEAEIAIQAEDLDLDIRPQVALDLGEQRLHRLAHLLLVDLPVRLEVGLAVVTLQAVKEL